jgi:prepilin-type N-terminal cleavage/methylation domain-containing protein
MKTQRVAITKFRRVVRDERGFTMQELLVVMIVGSLLISLSFSVYAFTHKLFLSWQTKSEGRDAVERVVQQVMYDIQKSKSIDAITDTTLILKSVYEKDVAFLFKNGNIYRNSTPLLYQPVMKIVVKISRAAQDSGSVVRCVNVEIEGGFKSNIWKANATAAILASSRGEFTDGH